MTLPFQSITEPRLLDAVDYPTDKAMLLRRATTIDAPDAVLKAIGRLPVDTFRSRDELTAAIEAIASR